MNTDQLLLVTSAIQEDITNTKIVPKFDALLAAIDAYINGPQAENLQRVSAANRSKTDR